MYSQRKKKTGFYFTDFSKRQFMKIKNCEDTIVLTISNSHIERRQQIDKTRDFCFKICNFFTFSKH